VSTDREVTLDYLRTPPGAPWRWEDGGRALVWKDGATIVFREELALIFARLAPGELPDFPVLVCVLAACRGRYLAFPRAASALGGALAGRAEQLAAEQMRKLAALPADVIGHPRGKVLLAQIVFEASERESGVDAAQAGRGLAAGLGDRELNATHEDALPFDVAGTIHRATQPLRAHTAETLRLRLRTGLDFLPTKVTELVLPRGERARRLLAKLAESDEHRGVALLVRDIMAAIRLPSVLARADEQATGGASGLGNRGTLDRLLISELAHDDITLATRVALNEALYLHREPPARRPRRGLALLLDSGLRMWGVPRVLATATGLALLAGWSDETEAGAWRAEGEAIAPVDLLDATALTAHLALLGTDLDPGRALPAFWAKVEAGGEMDAVIVTHREALLSDEFRRSLAQTKGERGFLVLIDNTGRVELHALPWGGGRALAQIETDLEKVFSVARTDTKAMKTAAPLDPAASLDLPASLRARPFPLLLPVTGKLDRTVQMGEGGLCVTADGRLFRWDKAGHGARQLLAAMPGGRTCFLEGDADGGITVVRGRDGTGKMAVIRLEPGAHVPNVLRLSGPHQPLAVRRERGAILLFLHTRVEVVAPDASAHLATTAIPDGLRPIGGRYFVDGQDLLFAVWNGSTVQWDRTVIRGEVRVAGIQLAFDRDGIGPWTLMKDGRILAPGGAEYMKVGLAGFTNPIVLHAGKELMVNSLKGDYRHLLDLYKRTSRVIKADRLSADSATLLPPPTRQLQSRITAIYAAPGQPLRLRNAKGRWLEIYLDHHGLKLVEAAKPFTRYEAGMRLFTDLVTPASLGCKLKRVSWPDGSVAWLDDRGLLHLRSKNPDVAELTLTLGVGQTLAVWTSNRLLAGPEFFTGTQSSTPSSVVMGVLFRFSNGLC
jgi:MoxR-vWA-beta-propeller ternary system domain bpX1/MoxR-vWA-beta-propeller ternary system domain bpX0